MSGIVTTEVESWTEFFTILCDKKCITPYDIVYLQKIAHELERDRLYYETLEYTKKRENDILHFEKRPYTLGEK